MDLPIPNILLSSLFYAVIRILSKVKQLVSSSQESTIKFMEINLGNSQVVSQAIDIAMFVCYPIEEVKTHGDKFKAYHDLSHR